MIILNGKLDIVLEWRKRDWSCRAWGVSIGQGFLGWIVFRRLPVQSCGHPISAIVSSDEGTHYCGECAKEKK